MAVIGFGYVGSCIAATLADRGFDVVGVDTDPRLIEELARGYCRFQEQGLADMIFRGVTTGRLRVTTDSAELASADVVLIAVGTPIREKGALADEQLRGACLELSRHLRQGQLVVLKSTVPPGTTRDVVLPLLEQSGLIGGVDFGLAFTPERLAEGTALAELRTFPIVAGGLEPDSTRDVAAFWHRVLGVEVIPLDSLESAEIVKLADNWWIDLNIALANELAKFCALYDVDVLDVIAAANTIPKGKGTVNILLPSVGVGGSCLTKDPWMVWRSARRRGVEILTAPAGREVNAGMPEYTAQLAIDELVKLGKNPATAKVAVLGLAFKNNTGDLRATPTRGVVETLVETGAQVRIFDPLVDVAHAEELFGITPAASLQEAVQDADCIAVLALHREFEDIDFAALPVARSCLLLDGRAYYSKEKIASLRRLGYLYQGIGRVGAPAAPDPHSYPVAPVSRLVEGPVAALYVESGS
ncbi:MULTISPECIES: nucleotide sugar dehydrogenase [Streptosporangium]|uniref:UDP-N-acetyl-D-mannosaminuronic acid dehydrogenase n=1 Tax=Streptosporangium brasiliense TaxID=47480 RepID=A0ABT9RLU7_9ACTN|nr:nucleotide sugar dehydrogenase [Streptosporangium brasiliense]MDP9870266.1 UDP-N-acetyl-D-mannosaminuronic acid dehydrogenase [Streptosporangium brasiliense]